MKYIYRSYFQKSHVFLYPLLKVKKFKHIKPASVYMFNKDFKGHKLYCIFNMKDKDWKKFEEHLLTHSMLESCQPIGEHNILFMFDFSCMNYDYSRVKAGEYSKMSPKAKRIIIDYYGIRSSLFVHIESFLYPEKYYDKFAECLNIDVNVLRKGVELCEKPNFVKEVCKINLTEKILL